MYTTKKYEGDNSASDPYFNSSTANYVIIGQPANRYFKDLKMVLI